METLIGHVAPGFGFLVIGLWHLFNHVKLHYLNSNYYISFPWFPTSRFRYLELILIICGCSASISMELFIGPHNHQPFDSDSSIPLNHLHNFEHASISMTFFVYASFSILLDRISPKAKFELTQLMASIAFAQQLLLFHLHSSDHIGPEGQYHFLLQLVIFVSLSTSLIGIALPKNFLLGFLRSLSIFFQGIWLIIMGFMLWIPELMPKGCFMHLEEGHKVVRCKGDKWLHRAKSLINIQFSWLLIGISIFAVLFYLILNKLYGGKIEYVAVTKQLEEKESNNIESLEGSVIHNRNSFFHMGQGFAPIDMER